MNGLAIRKIMDNPTACGLAYRWSRAGRRQQFSILTYHRVFEKLDPYYFFGIELPLFEAQLAMLSRFCAVLPLDEIIHSLERGRPLPRRCVALTFDDGYRDLYTLAMPLLERYRLPALVYAVVQAMEGGLLWTDILRCAIRTTERTQLRIETLGEVWSFRLDTATERITALRQINRRLKKIANFQKDTVLAEITNQLLNCSPQEVNLQGLMLSWEDLRGLIRRGLGVGCHTMTHPILTKVSESDCEYEIQGSLDVLQTKLNSRVCHFAYPNGTAEDYSPAVRSLIRSAGFRSACTTAKGTNRLSQNLWELNRIDGNCGSVWELTRSMTGVAGQ